MMGQSLLYRGAARVYGLQVEQTAQAMHRSWNGAWMASSSMPFRLLRT